MAPVRWAHHDPLLAAGKYPGRAADELRGGYLNHYGDYSSAQIAEGLTIPTAAGQMATARRISKTVSGSAVW